MSLLFKATAIQCHFIVHHFYSLDVTANATAIVQCHCYSNPFFTRYHFDSLNNTANATAIQYHFTIYNSYSPDVTAKCHCYSIPLLFNAISSYTTSTHWTSLPMPLLFNSTAIRCHLTICHCHSLDVTTNATAIQYHFYHMLL